jgi:hypothetical protein
MRRVLLVIVTLLAITTTGCIFPLPMGGPAIAKHR